MKVVDFKQGLFALTPRPGGQLSEASIGSAVQRSGFTLGRVVLPSLGTSTQPVSPTDAASKLIASARRAFLKGDVDGTVEAVAALAKQIPSLSIEPEKVSRDNVSPRDADALQFLALVSFSQQNFDDAAKYTRLALLRTAPWDWRTLSGHYVKSEVYIGELRQLEQSIRTESSPSKRFLIACHYWMMGHHDSARTQFEKAAVGEPDDKLIPELLQRLSEIPNHPSSKVSKP